jgi:drug/metabolite transporter (DMT)-like permease
MQSRKAIGYIYATIGMIAFSFTFIGVRLGFESFSPVMLSFGRIVPVAMFAIIVLKLSGANIFPAKADLPKVIGVAIGVVIGFPALTTLALQHIPAGESGVIIALAPIASAVIGVIYGHKHPGLLFWVASILGTIAAIAFALSRGASLSNPENVIWYFVVLIAVIVSSWGHVTGATLAAKHKSFQVISWGIVVAIPLNVPIALWDLFVVNPMTQWPTVSAWFGYLYVSFFSMFLGFFLWYAGMDRVGVAKTSQLQLAQPIFTLLWAIIFLAESVGPDTWVAAAAIVAAVGWTQRVNSRKK